MTASRVGELVHFDDGGRCWPAFVLSMPPTIEGMLQPTTADLAVVQPAPFDPMSAAGDTILRLHQRLYVAHSFTSAAWSWHTREECARA